MHQPGTDATATRITSLCEEPLRALGMDLEAVELTPAGKRRVLRVAVDKDGGVSMDDVADATREVARVLDETDVMGERAYTLEVTSRGVDRPLTAPRHWRRNRDRLVRVALAAPLEGQVTGRVVAVDEDPDSGGVTLDVNGAERALAWNDVDRAVVQVEFNRKPDTDPEGQEEA